MLLLIFLIVHPLTKWLLKPVSCFICLLLELVDALEDQRLPDGTMENVGKVLMKWVCMKFGQFFRGREGGSREEEGATE